MTEELIKGAKRHSLDIAAHFQSETQEVTFSASAFHASAAAI